ncbi:hypothetical protein C0992_007071 [Termitomyces sp. T32_za158]|nr:hypothetical protein C0992_007071 [Termitomyces sp. T32_za158]
MRPMQRLTSRLFSRQNISHNDPAPHAISENEYEKELMLSEEAQWNDTFQESLRDFQLKFEEEEMARSVGEHGRLDVFNRTMTEFHDIFMKNHLRRLELYERTDALQKERIREADAAREAIFVQGQQNRAYAYKIEQEMRSERMEWYSTTRREFFRDGRQKLAEKCDALNAALVEQFNRLMEREKEMGEVSKEQPNNQDTVSFGDGQYSDGSSGPMIPQLVTSLPSSSKSPSSSPHAKDDSPSQPTSTESNDHQDRRISHSPSPSMSLFPSSTPNPESLTSSTQPTSPDSNDEPEQEGSTQSDGVEEDKLELNFMRSQERRQDTFLQDEGKRTHRFNASEAARNAEESKRSTTFGKKMKQWSTKSQTEQIHGREEERFQEIRRSTAFREAASHRLFVFEMSMRHIMDQTYAEEDLEEIHFKHREDMLLALYERQAIQLDQQTKDQLVWLGYMRHRKAHDWRMAIEDDEERYPATGFAPGVILRGPLIHKALPIPKVTDNVESDMHKRQGRFVVSMKMQEMFECSQELRAQLFQKGAKERNYTFTINEAKREAEFGKIQQNRKELFDEAEDLRESEFERVQEQRELEFQANERKREDDFDKNEAERNDRARKAQETRAQQFQSMMSKLQQLCIYNEEGRLKELELLGEELIMCREQGTSLSCERFPQRLLYR